MLARTEGTQRNAEYIAVVLGFLVYAALSVLQVRFRVDGFRLGGIVLEPSTVVGLSVPLQVMISLFLALRKEKAGFVAAAALNAGGMLSALVFTFLGSTLVLLPCVLWDAIILAALLTVRAYRDKVQAHLRKIGEQERSNRFFSRVFEQAPVGIAVVKGKAFPESGRFDDLSMNARFEQILGRSREQLQGVSWADLTHPEDLAEDLRLYGQFADGTMDSYSMTKRFLRPDGSPVWVDMQISAFARDGEERPEHLCILTDISERKRMEEALVYNLEHVPLTGLENRVVLERALAQDRLTAHGQRGALLNVNLVGLDALSFRYGHPFSRKIIKQAAEALKAFRGGRRTLYQSAENRFVLHVMDPADLGQLVRLAEEISAALHDLLRPYGSAFGIGVVETDAMAGENVNELLKDLLVASDRAAAGGGGPRNVCFWSEELRGSVARENAIACALEEVVRGTGEGRLSLQYQPIWDAAEDRVYAVEALARLTLADYGMILPKEFIRIAERNHMIVPLGEEITRRAFRFIHRVMEHRSEGIFLSVNVSIIQLLDDGFEDRFIRQLIEAQVDPGQIVVELTESILSQDYPEIKNAVGKLKACGIKVMLDDFGTGYSSFERFAELDIDCVKIDKLFVDKMQETATGNAIVVNMIEMAHTLGRCTVAEGVEQEGQRGSLLGFGCDRIQGYLISKPLDEEDALTFEYHGAQNGTLRVSGDRVGSP